MGILLTTLFLRTETNFQPMQKSCSSHLGSVTCKTNSLRSPTLRDEVSNEVGRNLTSLSSVLQSLQKAGVAVKLMTHPLDGNWKREWSATAKERERNFSLAFKGWC